jgi:enamine deaminase RidA (YjgF/YER057c/UK114 family)
VIKKIAAAFMAVLVFGGLAYYSGILYLEKSVPENQAYMKAPVVFFPEEQRLEQEEQKEYKENPLKDTETARRQVSARADRVLAEACQYYLVEEQGRVNIYLSDRETVYEYTDITMDMLPEELQQEITAGKGLSGERELYDFLENYSS